MTLTHTTITSGHSRISPRAEVSDDIIEMLKPLLKTAIARQKRGSKAHVEIAPSDWYIRAREAKDRQSIVIGLWWGMPSGDAMIETRITLHSETESLCEVWLTRPDALTPAAAFQAGDIERCMAWAWITLKAEQAK